MFGWLRHAITYPAALIVRRGLRKRIEEMPEQIRALGEGDEKMKARVIAFLMEQLHAVLTPELFKRVLDSIIDVLENAIASSETKTDDAVLLPLIAMLRTSLNIPDND